MSAYSGEVGNRFADKNMRQKKSTYSGNSLPRKHADGGNSIAGPNKKSPSPLRAAGVIRRISFRHYDQWSRRARTFFA